MDPLKVENVSGRDLDDLAGFARTDQERNAVRRYLLDNPAALPAVDREPNLLPDDRGGGIRREEPRRGLERVQGDFERFGRRPLEMPRP